MTSVLKLVLWVLSVRLSLSVCDTRSQYRPYGTNFCCNKCVRGQYKVSDCEGEGQQTKCDPCLNETFLEFENHLNSCIHCDVCKSEFDQIEILACKATQNRVCGCPRGMFRRVLGEDTFECRHCSLCPRGIHSKCTQTKNTICRCEDREFFNYQTDECQDCDLCQGQEICHSICSKNPDLLVIILMISVVVAGVIIIVLVVWFRSKTHSFTTQANLTTKPEGWPLKEEGCKERGGVQEEGAPSPLTSHAYNPLDPAPKPINPAHLPPPNPAHPPPPNPAYLPPPNPAHHPPPNPAHFPPNSAPDLPDCVTASALTPLNSSMTYSLAELVPLSRWKEFVRRLGVSDSEIERCEFENRLSLREGQYSMVRSWAARRGRYATLQAVCKVLADMELNSASDALQDSLGGLGERGREGGRD